MLMQRQSQASFYRGGQAETIIYTGVPKKPTSIYFSSLANWCRPNSLFFGHIICSCRHVAACYEDSYNTQLQLENLFASAAKWKLKFIRILQFKLMELLNCAWW